MGKRSVNTSADVSTVQRLLRPPRKAHDPSLDPKGIDGKIAHVAAITYHLGHPGVSNPVRHSKRPDLSNGDQTWTKLLAAAGETTP